MAADAAFKTRWPFEHFHSYFSVIPWSFSYDRILNLMNPRRKKKEKKKREKEGGNVYLEGKMTHTEVVEGNVFCAQATGQQFTSEIQNKEDNRFLCHLFFVCLFVFSHYVIVQRYESIISI